jgi:hypothetical protein
MKRLVPLLRRRGLERGVFGHSRVWMAVWAVLTVGRLFRRLTRPKPVVERFELKPGETVVIAHLPEPADP